MKDRDLNLDALRVIAAFTVVWLHISAHVVTSNPSVHSLTWWIGNIADSLSRWCVPMFVMVSGALLLSSHAESQIRIFYQNRASRLIPPIVFWTVFYIFFQYRDDIISIDNTVDIFKSIVQGDPYFHMWYLYMIMGLYLIAPFLKKIVRLSSEKSLRFLIVAAFVISATDSLVGELFDNRATFLSSFLPFIAYFLSGHYLYCQSKTNVHRKYMVLIAFLCGVIIAMGTAALLTVLGPTSWEIMYSYLNPLVIIMSLCLFRLGLDFSFSSFIGSSLIRRIAPITLGIYLIHPLWIIVSKNFGLTAFYINPIIGIPITTVVVFLFSTISVLLLSNIPIMKTTVM